MTGLSFLNAPLLWGILAAAIPLIIHLLYRRRFRRVEWAPMRYLKLSVEKHRRRIRLEQLLLLLVRMAAMVLLFLLLARPVMHAEGLAGWLSARHRQSRLLIIDDSLSMGLQDGGSTPWTRAKEVAREMIQRRTSRDRLTIVLSSRPLEPVVREVELTDRQSLLTLIDELQPSATFTDWAPTLVAVDQLLAGSTYPIQEVTLLTDLCLPGWEQPIVELAEQWQTRDTHLEIFDLGSTTTGNLAVLELSQIEHLALAGTPTHWEAAVRNDTDAEVRELEANWLVDGKPNLTRIESLPPGATTRVRLPVTFNDPGPHHVAFRLPADALPGDNQRWGVTDVKPLMRIVLVDGEPSTDPLGGEVDFLAIALSLGVGQAEAFEVLVVTEAEWAQTNLANVDLLVLANLSGVTEAEAHLLSKSVAEGLGLVIFPGDQVDPDAYNRWLYRQGEGLLPAGLEAIVDEDLQGLLIEPVETSPLTALRALKPSVLEQIRAQSYWQLTDTESAVTRDEAPRDDVRVIARWNNTAGSPAALEKRWGKGQVLLWTIPADKQWSSWPTQPSFVLAMRESTLHLARRGADSRTLTAGAPLRHEIPGGPNSGRSRIAAAQIDVPGRSEPQTVSVDTNRVVLYAPTVFSGLYRLHWQSPAGPDGEAHFAVNPDVRESDLTRITREALLKHWHPLVPDVITPTNRGTSLALQGQEIWRTLAMGLLGLLCLESCLATWTGRSR